jgi:branched-chain amino acid transport system permease protein
MNLLHLFISIVFHGLAYAMVLYVISVGLSLTMGLLGFANLAHGVFAMAGGYVTLTLMSHAGIPFAPALILSFVAIALGSLVLERLLYRHLYGAGELDQTLLTIGLIFMATAVAHFVFGPLPQRVDLPAAISGHFMVGGRDFPTYRAFLIFAGVVIFVTLWLGIERTLIGAKIRAAVDNRSMAQCVGIDTGLLFAIIFALGSGLAAIGGSLGADIIAIYPGYAMEHLVYFLIVVSVGGLGTIKGPFYASILLGVGDTACKILVPSLGAFFIYAAVLALLIYRPAGLFGKATA